MVILLRVLALCSLYFVLCTFEFLELSAKNQEQSTKHQKAAELAFSLDRQINYWLITFA
jgi:hypothetical protein